MHEPPPERRPTVAVVIPCFNVATTVTRTVESVRSQPNTSYEIIAVDDGSTDDTKEVLSRPSPPVRLISQPHGGACCARNAGLAEVTAPYVVFLDGDDWLEGPMLRGACDAANAAGADIALSRQQVLNDGVPGQFRDFFHSPRKATSVFENWHFGQRVNTASLLWRTDFVRSIGGWDERVLLDQDGEIFLRALIKGAKIAHNPFGFSVYNRTAGSICTSITEEKIINFFEAAERLCQLSKNTAFEHKLSGLNYNVYKFTRESFQKGFFTAGHIGLAVMRHQGWSRHFGTASHRAVASILGLELKVRLWGR